LLPVARRKKGLAMTSEVAPATGAMVRLRGFDLRRFGVYAALVAVVIFNLAFTPNFASFNNLRLQLVQVTPTVIVALGMALVIGTAGIDLSVGSVMALAAATLAVSLEQGPWAAVGLAVAAGAAAGLVNGTLVGVIRIQPIVATLGLFVAGRGIALVIAKGRLTEIFDPTIRAIGTSPLVGGIQAGVFVAGLLAIATAVIVRWTVFGRHILAVGGNREAATAAGLPVRRTLIVVYILCAVFAAIAGILATARSAASDPSFVGLLIELSAITAVVVGGTPLSGGRVRVLATVAGAVLMQLIFATLIRHDLTDSDARMAQAAIIVVAVYFQRERLK
jgi:ribose transport system permease protein